MQCVCFFSSDRRHRAGPCEWCHIALTVEYRVVLISVFRHGRANWALWRVPSPDHSMFSTEVESLTFSVVPYPSMAVDYLLSATALLDRGTIPYQSNSDVLFPVLYESQTGFGEWCHKHHHNSEISCFLMQHFWMESSKPRTIIMNGASPAISAISVSSCSVSPLRHGKWSLWMSCLRISHISGCLAWSCCGLQFTVTRHEGHYCLGFVVRNKQSW